MSSVVFAVGPDNRFGVWTCQWEGGQPSLQPAPAGAAAEAVLLPGFVDVHIHGAFGLDWMKGGSACLPDLADGLAEKGYEAFLPTTITCSADEAAEVLDGFPMDHPMIPGFHLEGPFISPEFPGAQPQDRIAAFPEPGSGPWTGILGHPLLKVVTLAPELPGALPMISWLAERGVRPSMGHTAAAFDQAQRGVDAGVCHATHTYNAMKGLHHREAGALGCALSDPRVDCELIYDRIHVSTPAARVLLAAKGLDKVIAVSDSSLATGLPPGSDTSMWGLDVVVGDGEVRLKSNGALAGSAITLLDAFRRLAQDFGTEAAIRLCSLNPRRALGLHGPPRVWLCFDMDLHDFQIKGC